MSQSERANFGSKIGVILATAGSAVGLGNIWRFPTMAGQDGGSAFIIIYLICTLLLGLPGMMSEFIVGRHGASNAFRAYKSISDIKAFGLIGAIGVLASSMILGFYSVVAGWCVYYLFAAIMGQVLGDQAYVENFFISLSNDPIRPALMSVAFVLLTHFVVARGVKKGIEKAANILMPLLFLLLLILVVASLTLPGAMAGVEFLFKPDFSKVTARVVLDAMGQAFFSLSLGTACLCTYASYFSKKTDLAASALQIITIDILIAILAGLMIFPAAFSVGVNPDSGPSLIFITLPNVFQQAFGAIPGLGYVISILFYALLALAALTSTISMHEIGTAYMSEEKNMDRKKAAAFITVFCSVLGVLCSWSLGAMPQLSIADKSLFDCFDFLTGQIMLPLGGLFTCLLIGWLVPTKVVRDEFTNEGTKHTALFTTFLWVVRIVCPIGIAVIFLNQFGLIPL